MRICACERVKSRFDTLDRHGMRIYAQNSSIRILSACVRIFSCERVNSRFWHAPPFARPFFSRRSRTSPRSTWTPPRPSSRRESVRDSVASQQQPGCLGGSAFGVLQTPSPARTRARICRLTAGWTESEPDRWASAARGGSLAETQKRRRPPWHCRHDAARRGPSAQILHDRAGAPLPRFRALPCADPPFSTKIRRLLVGAGWRPAEREAQHPHSSTLGSED